MDDNLIIANKSFTSRLMLGTGRFVNQDIRLKAVEKSNCEILTVAIRRLEKLSSTSQDNFISKLNWKNLWLLPNTSGAQTAEEAIRLAFLGHELAKKLNQFNNKFVKLEVISDKKYLFPDPLGTFKAAKFLINKGFTVLPYINADLILAKHLQDIGCATVMPLASPIGSGQGLKNIYNIQLIANEIKIPVIVDAGIGTPSDVTKAMELGVDGILLNTAIAKANNPVIMAEAMRLAVRSGRLSYLTGLMSKKDFAIPSSPDTGMLF